MSKGGEGNGLVGLERRVLEDAKVVMYVITMSNGENRFNPAFLREFLSCLDRIEQEVAQMKEKGAADGEMWGAAVLTTGGGGQPKDKFYSNGIDLRWVEDRRRAGDTAALRTLGSLFGTAVARILSFPLPTFAGTYSQPPVQSVPTTDACAASPVVLNGHCFAGAFMLAFAHDYRCDRHCFLCAVVILSPNHANDVTHFKLDEGRSRMAVPARPRSGHQPVGSLLRHAPT